LKAAANSSVETPATAASFFVSVAILPMSRETAVPPTSAWMPASMIVVPRASVSAAVIFIVAAAPERRRVTSRISRPEAVELSSSLLSADPKRSTSPTPRPN
jgi:hypothetical protein